MLMLKHCVLRWKSAHMKGFRYWRRMTRIAPWEQIVETAKDRKMDLIVIDSRGYSGLKRVILGSTAERVVRYTECPVLAGR